MHIILGILGPLVTILILLNKLAEAGFDLYGLNPFLWDRRRKWKAKHDGSPVYKIDSPMDATAILMVAAAKADGDLTRESKHFLLESFEQDFNLDKKDAAGLLISSSHLLADGALVSGNVDKFLSLSKDKFTEHQAHSALDLIAKAAGEEGQRHQNAVELLARVSKVLGAESQVEKGTW